MSLGLRHLAWVRARFSGLCRATARLADGVVPLVPPPPCSPAFYPHLLCASPAQLVSSLPHAPPPVAPVGHGSSLQGPVVHCADLCPVPGVSESCAQFSALTTVLPSPPARFSVSEPAPPRRPVPGPGRLPCADGARSASPQAFTRPPPPPQPSLARSFLCLRFLFPGHRALLEKCFVQVTEWFRCQFMARSLTVPSFPPVNLFVSPLPVLQILYAAPSLAFPFLSRVPRSARRGPATALRQPGCIRAVSTVPAL